jgi:hypothetical protein
MQWILNNLGVKPASDWQMHVLKTKQYPHGYFGPGGIVWRHKRDRHDQASLDVISEMSNEQREQFVKAENAARACL